MFASIPFNITTAIVTRLTTASCPPDDTYLVVQREAANKFLGKPRESLYAVLLKPWFELDIVHLFRRSDFVPTPHVDVVMLRLRKRGPFIVSLLICVFAVIAICAGTGGEQHTSSGDRSRCPNRWKHPGERQLHRNQPIRHRRYLSHLLHRPPRHEPDHHRPIKKHSYSQGSSLSKKRKDTVSNSTAHNTNPPLAIPHLKNEGCMKCLVVSN